MIVENWFLLGGKPRQVERERRVIAVEFPQFLARKDAQQYVRQRLDRMLHLVEDRRLEAEKIAGQRVIEDLPSAVRQHLVPERPARQNGVQIYAAAPLRHDGRARIGRQLRRFEAADEPQLLRGE